MIATRGVPGVRRWAVAPSLGKADVRRNQTCWPGISHKHDNGGNIIYKSRFEWKILLIPLINGDISNRQMYKTYKWAIFPLPLLDCQREILKWPFLWYQTRGEWATSQLLWWDILLVRPKCWWSWFGVAFKMEVHFGWILLRRSLNLVLSRNFTTSGYKECILPLPLLHFYK